MIVYHRTRNETAQAIQREGFREGSGAYLTACKWLGVWVSDRPLDEDEGGSGDTLLEISLPSEVLDPWEWNAPGQNYREWLVPSELLNTHGVIKIRE